MPRDSDTRKALRGVSDLMAEERAVVLQLVREAKAIVRGVIERAEDCH